MKKTITLNKIERNKIEENRLIVSDKKSLNTKKCVMFSFEMLETNEYFNLDGTCVNWSSDLFNTLKEVSKIEVSHIFGGRYSGKKSKLRIHSHEDAKLPCNLSQNIELDEFYQIRLGKSKGGIHGIFIDNIFYIIWLDPQHNMYPSENHGGLKKIKPPSTCCKDRDSELIELKKENEKLKNDISIWEELVSTQTE